MLLKGQPCIDKLKFTGINSRTLDFFINSNAVLETGPSIECCNNIRHGATR